MSIFIVGGTGTLGQPVVRQLVTAGIEVRALARSSANVSQLRALGAEPVRADLFDRAQMERALQGSKRVLHLATKIPPARKAASKAAWEENDRIRTQGTRVLVDSALAAGVMALVYPSICLTYPDQRAAWIDTDTELQPGGSMLQSTVTAEKEVARFSAMGVSTPGENCSFVAPENCTQFRFRRGDGPQVVEPSLRGRRFGLDALASCARGLIARSRSVCSRIR